MGGTSSHMQPQQPLIEHQLPIVMHDSTNPYQQPPYPDMNQIFKGIPKMMQAADDMHRLTNYMQDLRNLMFVCTGLGAVGIFFFVVLKYLHSRKSTRRRKQRTHSNQRTDDSEQSSLSISRPNNYRHYNSSSRPVDNWTQKIEMDRMMDSTSTRHTNMTHGGLGPHALALTNKAMAASPEHQQHHYNTSSPMHMAAQQQQQQRALDAAAAEENNTGIGGGSSMRPSPAPTPTSTSHMQCGQLPTLTLHAAPAQQQQPNGQLKRLDPVKLIVDEMPYADNE